MLQIITNLIRNAINPDKIPGLDCFDIKNESKGEFAIRLNDGSVIRVIVASVER
jgi:hypothetical protein